MYFTSLVLDALTANTELWSKTALFLMYDENDGWFDHVPPPTPPAGTPGEYLTATPSQALRAGRLVDRRSASPGRSASACACRCSSSHRSAAAATSRPRRSTTPPSCSSSRRASGSKSPTCRPGGARPSATSLRRCSSRRPTRGCRRCPPPPSSCRSPEHARQSDRTPSLAAPPRACRPSRRCRVQGGGSEASVEVLPDNGQAGRDPRRRSHVTELPLTRIPDDEVAPQSARRPAAEPRLASRSPRSSVPLSTIPRTRTRTGSDVENVVDEAHDQRPVADCARPRDWMRRSARHRRRTRPGESSRACAALGPTPASADVRRALRHPLHTGCTRRSPPAACPWSLRCTDPRRSSQTWPSRALRSCCRRAGQQA